MSILENVQKLGSYKEIAPGEWAGPCPECGGAMRFRVFPERGNGACLVCGFIQGEEDCATGTGFDRAKMDRALLDTQSRIQSGWQNAAWEWLEQHRSDVIGYIRRTEAGIDGLFEKEDEPGLFKALTLLEEAYTRAWKVYTERPPVIARCKKQDGDCVCCGECDIDKEEIGQ